MPSLIDRYLVRETLLPFLLSLLLITFLLIIPPILQQGYALIAKGVEWSVVMRVLVTLLPQALSISIPMAVLMGLLIAFGRLSADREFVAMQACGVSVYRLLRPVAFIALVATAVTGYVLIVALPNANQTFREITVGEVSSLIENNVKPRVFFDTFPNRVIYVRDLPAGGGWRDIFLADTSRPGETNVYFAREGRILVDREKKLVQLQLMHGTEHTTLAAQPDEYHGTDFESTSLNLDPQTVFPPPPSRGVPEMTIADLRRTIVDAEKRGDTILGYNSRFMIQYKFSFPVACCVLALIGLALGFSNRKDGKLASFVIGISVSFVYYVLLYMARAAAIGGVMSPDFAPWIPPTVLGVAGVALLLWRARSTDRPILITLPLRRASAELSGGSGLTIPMSALPAPVSRPAKVVFVIRVPHFSLPWSILDVYTSRQYLRVFVLTVLAALGVFYISTFIDLADKLFRGAATTANMLQFFYYLTPQYVYYVIPIAGLVATLVTIGTMTKNSELVVMRACGVSLYRTAVPLLLFAVAASGVLFAMQELVLARANQEADRLNSVIRGYPAQTISELNRWVASEKGDVYHYDFFDQRADRFARFTLYHLDQPAWRLSSITYAESVSLAPASVPGGTTGGRAPVWKARNGWVRTVTLQRTGNVTKTAVTDQPFAERDLLLEPPRYFKTETPDAQKMTYGQLNDYITQLKASGFNAVPPMVQLQRKVAFPFVTVIMTLLAVPFAVTTGRRGALGGIGIGIALSIVYWVVFSIFGALGEGGVTTPVLAAWAPNILFGAAALYMVLTVRT
jgi:LPS export ABC transporter permease LptG/LPS export ABC transporter permease LptF